MPRSKSSPTTETELPADQALLGLPGVGPRTAERLEAAGLTRLEDLLLFAPRRYDDAGALAPLGALVPGEQAYVEGKVVRAGLRRFFRRATLEVVLEDATGARLLLRWFRFRGAVPERFAIGRRVRAAGLVRQGKRGLELVQPVAEDAEAEGRARALRPRYRRITGVPQGTIERLASVAQRALVEDPLGVPSGLPSLRETARALHALPPLPDEAERAVLVQGRSRAHHRLAFEELLLLRLAARRRRETVLAPRLDADPERVLAPIYAAMRFPPTAAQRRAIGEVAQQIAGERPMRRLLTGDVGSGKTLVAGAAIELCCASGFRAALLAPTALLAEQQAEVLLALLAPSGRRVALYHAGVPRAQRSRIAAELAAADGPLDLVVGTHALLDESLALTRLGLVVIDEQQRFGVLQRASLVTSARQRGLEPHQLALSATPIPRSLALALRGAVELSHLDERPPGRGPLTTSLLGGPAALDEALALLRAELDAGGQAYWICPSIQEDEGSRGLLRAAEWLRAALGREVLVCHGKQAARERARQLASFRDHGGVLVATTVVEVGLDVPAATLMVIESPERLGLSQLHQLRGRVGRGPRGGRCVLCAPALLDLGAAPLGLLARVLDGLAIAEADLERRGMGELAGEEQSGMPSLPPLPAEDMARLAEAADQAAEQILRSDPELTEARHARLLRGLSRAERSERARRD